MRTLKLLLLLMALCTRYQGIAQNKTLVFQSDFGLKDGAVAAMKGVAYSVSPELRMFDNTHEISAFNILEAAYRLDQTAVYWPKGTVFVSIVDPGVGSARKSVVLLTKSGHFFVSPDNGTLTLVAESLGIQEVREIDESKNRRSGSQASYTFHGRDVYAYTAARLAAGVITFQQVGPVLKQDIVKLPNQKPVFVNGVVKGNIPVLDVQYGNVWTNIDATTFHKLNAKAGDLVHVKIFHNDKKVYEGDVPFANTFDDVKTGQPLGYLNSLLNFSLGINMGNFADVHQVSSGTDWTVELSR